MKKILLFFFVLVLLIALAAPVYAVGVDERTLAVIEPQFNAIGDSSDGVFPYRNNGLCGLVSASGSVVVKAKYEDIGLYSEGLVSVKENGVWKYITLSGETVIQTEYAMVDSFRGGKAVVYNGNGMAGLIDRFGNEILPCQYEEILNTEDTSVLVQTEDGWSFLSPKTRAAIGNKLNCPIIISDNANIYVICSQNGFWGVLDFAGNVIIPFEYDVIDEFSDGLFTARKGEIWMLLDKNATVLLQGKYLYMGPYSGGYVGVVDENGSRYLTLDGREIIPNIKGDIVYLYPFAENRAVLQLANNLHVIIDENGEQIGEYEYSFVSKFTQGLALTNVETTDDLGATINKWCIIDKNGETVMALDVDVYAETDRWGSIDMVDGCVRTIDRITGLMGFIRLVDPEKPKDDTQDHMVTLNANITQSSTNELTITAHAASTGAMTGHIVFAIYDANGQMLDVQIHEASEIVTSHFDLCGASAKVMWVDSLRNFRPLCEALELSTEVVPDGLYYTLHGSYVEITKYAGTAADLTIPKTIEGVPVTKIGRYAFDGCTSLKTLTLQSGIIEIDAFAFNNCTSLDTIVLPDGLKAIGDLAFQSCRKLTTITIPDGVTVLGWNIFNNCLALKETHIPTSVVTVDDKTIVWDHAGTGITVSGDISSYFFSYWTELENVVVEGGCTFIGEGAFRNCTSLTSIVLPESITTMEPRVFADCTNLLSVTVPSKVTELGDFTFSGCRSMTNIVLPASLKTIGSYVFQSCDSFIEVEIPTGTTVIGDGAFNVCRNVKTIIIPDSVTSISDTAFNYCTSLTICCSKGSYADTYAQSKGVSVQYM